MDDWVGAADWKAAPLCWGREGFWASTPLRQGDREGHSLCRAALVTMHGTIRKVLFWTNQKVAAFSPSFESGVVDWTNQKTLFKCYICV